MVAVQTHSGQLDEEQVKAIRNVVASAYAGLDRHNITITDLNGGDLRRRDRPGWHCEDESIYATHKLRYEREWQRKIQRTAGVHSRRHCRRQRRAESRDRCTVMQHGETRSQAGDAIVPGIDEGIDRRSTRVVGGRPGRSPTAWQFSQCRSQHTAVQRRGESQLTETRTDIKNVAGPRHDVVANSPRLVPKKVTASIDIPASYYVEVWKSRNPQPADKPAKPPDPAELATIETEIKKRLKETVRNLLPDVDQGHQSLSAHRRRDLHRSAQGRLPPPTLAATAGTWLADNWQTLALVGVGLISLLMLRSMVRSSAMPRSDGRSSHAHANESSAPPA